MRRLLDITLDMLTSGFLPHSLRNLVQTSSAWSARRSTIGTVRFINRSLSLWLTGLLLSLAPLGSLSLASELSVLVSIPDQQLLLFQDGLEKDRFTVSTSRFGTGDRWGSYATPLGALQIADKIGDRAKEGAVFKERHLTGEVLPPNAPGRDPIVTRILWLRGLERQNANAFPRFIYIHGTPEERMLGTPVSWGCIRMRSKDVIKLFETVEVGTRVEILNRPVKALLKEHVVASPLAQALRD